MWLVYFSQAPSDRTGLGRRDSTWPVLTAGLALFLTGVAAGSATRRAAPSRYHAWPRTRLFLFDQMLAGIRGQGTRLHVATMGIALLVAVAVQITRYQRPYAPREWIVLVARSMWAWQLAWYRGAQAPSLAASFLMQLCVAALAAVRRQLMLTTNLWSYEYDVWTSLAVSILLTGARGLLERQPRPSGASLLTSLCALPVLAMVWVLVHGLGANLALLVVGLHSVMFAYLGRRRPRIALHPGRLGRICACLSC